MSNDSGNIRLDCLEVSFQSVKMVDVFHTYQFMNENRFDDIVFFFIYIFYFIQSYIMNGGNQ